MAKLARLSHFSCSALFHHICSPNIILRCTDRIFSATTSRQNVRHTQHHAQWAESHTPWVYSWSQQWHVQGDQPPTGQKFSCSRDLGALGITMPWNTAHCLCRHNSYSMWHFTFHCSLSILHHGIFASFCKCIMAAGILLQRWHCRRLQTVAFRNVLNNLKNTGRSV